MRITIVLLTFGFTLLIADSLPAQAPSQRCTCDSTRWNWLRWNPRIKRRLAVRGVAPAELESLPVEGSSGPPMLFNGKDLTGWEVIEEYDFGRHGNVAVNDEAIILEAGTPATGIRIAGEFPRMSYEVSLEAKRITGSDFFCGITFPVGEDYLSLVLGGWGGGTTGISNLDGMSAVENTTTGFQDFEQDRWYRVRLAVTQAKVQVWIDDEQIVDVDHKDHKLSIWWEQEPVRPFGIASWYTKSALRNIQLRHLPD